MNTCPQDVWMISPETGETETQGWGQHGTSDPTSSTSSLKRNLPVVDGETSINSRHGRGREFSDWAGVQLSSLGTSLASPIPFQQGWMVWIPISYINCSGL